MQNQILPGGRQTVYACADSTGHTHSLPALISQPYQSGVCQLDKSGKLLVLPKVLSDLEEIEVGEGEEGAKVQAIPETGEEKGRHG